MKVDYTHLIDIARNHIEEHYRRSLGDRLLRLLLAKTLPYPRRFAAAIWLARLAHPFAGLAPGRLANLLKLAQHHRRTELIHPQTYPAVGARYMRVALLTGCAQQALDAEINAATIRLLTRHGCEVVIPEGLGCCGALPLHMGRQQEGRRLAQKNAEAWARLGALDAIVVNASGCGTTMKDYGHLLASEQGNRIGALTLDITELLMKLDLKITNTKYYRVAYHDACSLQHGQRVMQPPRRLLQTCAFEVVDVPEKHFCCGSAGTYNMLQPDISAALGKRKVSHAESVARDFIAAGNLGCMVQMRRYTRVPVLHTVSLIDWATGGPLPADLAGFALREPQVPNALPSGQPAEDPGGTSASGFW